MGIGEHIAEGIAAVFMTGGGAEFLGIGLPLPLLMVLFGLVTGIVAGSIPGIAGPMVMAVALPILIGVFGYDQSAFLPVMGFLIGVMKGATAGGAVPAILFNTPGTPDALMTTLDGYPMTKNGKAFKALRVAHFSSVSGDTLSDIVLFIGAPFLAVIVEAYLDLPEKAALILLSLCFIAAIVGRPVSKGIIAVGLGLFAASIGSGDDFTPRLAFGFDELGGGLPLASVILGTLVIGEVFMALHGMRLQSATRGVPTRHPVTGDNRLPWREKRQLLSYIAPSATLGAAIGALPGIGSTMAATLGYSAARRRWEAAMERGAGSGLNDAPSENATGDRVKFAGNKIGFDASGKRLPFGTGVPQGVAATEAANSAVSGANLIPVLSLGIPGNTAAVFLILAMASIDGINPGPSVFSLPSAGFNPEMVLAFGLFAMMACANLLNWVGGLHLMRLMGNMIRIPPQILMPSVLVLTIAAIHVQDPSLTAVLWLVAFGLLGFFMRLTQIPVLVFVIAFILGRPLERTAREDPFFLVSSPISIALMLASIGVLVYFARRPAS